MANLLQITPTYPPDISGVGDYTALLSGAFARAGHIVETLVARPEQWSGEGAKSLRRADANSLAMALQDTNNVLLHFSGYGYAHRGLCRWLVEGLARWKSMNSDRRLVTMFHEVYATGPIWRASFWTALPQMRIASELASFTDTCFVSSSFGAEQLRRIAAPSNCEILPVFSTVGEPSAVMLLSQRPTRAVVFGGLAQRQKVYEAIGRNERKIERLFSNLEIDEVIDIGPGSDIPHRAANIPIKSVGPLISTCVSRTLAECRLGLLSYASNRITKSSIHAAYLSHGVLAFNAGTEESSRGSPELPLHVLDFESSSAAATDAESIAKAGYAHYQLRNLACISRKLLNATQLAQVSAEPFA